LEAVLQKQHEFAGRQLVSKPEMKSPYYQNPHGFWLAIFIFRAFADPQKVIIAFFIATRYGNNE
jgi:hypothetical protein